SPSQVSGRRKEARGLAGLPDSLTPRLPGLRVDVYFRFIQRRLNRTMEIDKRFVFSGHAIGVSAHFHRLDDLHNLKHFIPTLGSSVLPPVGGLSHHQVKNFCYSADEPKRRMLLSAKHVQAT